MKFFKKLVATVLIACTALSFTACSDTTWAYKMGDKQVSSGLYIMQTMTAYTLAQSHKDKNPDIEDIFKQKLDGKPAKQWIIDEAKKGCALYLATEAKFDELGLTLTETDNNMIEQDYKEGWPAVGAFFEKNGVGEETYRTTLINTRKKEKIFEKYYGKDGLEQVTDESLMAHFKENFASINMFGLKLETGDDLTEEQIKTNENAKKSAEDLLEMLNKGDKTYNEVFVEYKKMENENLPDDEKKDVTVYEDDETKTFVQKGSNVPSEKVVKAIFEEVKVDGDGALLTDETGYFICKRYDVTKDKENFDEMRQSLLVDIKGAEFTELTTKWTDEIMGSITVNSASIKRYTPKNIDFTL